MPDPTPYWLNHPTWERCPGCPKCTAPSLLAGSIMSPELCSGSGVVERCPECEGKGYKRAESLPDHLENCLSCSGSGYLPVPATVECPECEGSGDLLPDRSVMHYEPCHQCAEKGDHCGSGRTPNPDLAPDFEVIKLDWSDPRRFVWVPHGSTLWSDPVEEPDDAIADALVTLNGDKWSVWQRENDGVWVVFDGDNYWTGPTHTEAVLTAWRGK